MNLIVSRAAPKFNGLCFSPKLNSFKQVGLDTFKNKYLYLMFYPLNFTFVCPTEIHSLNNLLPDFEKRNCNVLICSVDSHFSHQAWWNLDTEQGGLGKKTNLDMLSDLNGSISKSFGIYDDVGLTSIRGGFIIDGNGMVKNAGINDNSVGRNFNEVLRLIDAYQYTEKHGEVCPSGWNKEGDATMKTTHNDKLTKDYWKNFLGKK